MMVRTSGSWILALTIIYNYVIGFILVLVGLSNLNIAYILLGSTQMGIGASLIDFDYYVGSLKSKREKN